MEPTQGLLNGINGDTSPPHNYKLTCFFYVFIDIITPSRGIRDVIVCNEVNLQSGQQKPQSDAKGAAKQQQLSIAVTVTANSIGHHRGQSDPGARGNGKLK